MRRIKKYLILEKAKLMLFINIWFKYTTMMCIFCRTYKKEKNDLPFKIFESHTSYNDPLFLICEASIRQKDLRLLFTETYKSATNINPKFMKDYFIFKIIHIIYVLAQFSAFYQIFALTFWQIQHQPKRPQYGIVYVFSKKQKFEGIYWIT